jgi:hypothetical protein
MRGLVKSVEKLLMELDAKFPTRQKKKAGPLWL